MPTPPITVDETDPHLDWVASRPGKGCPNPYRQDVGNPIATAAMPNTSVQTAAGLDPVAWKRLIVNVLAVTSSAPAGATRNVAYTPHTFIASGGVAPFTWAVSVGTLPTGMTLNAQTGVLSGTATSAAGTSNFTVRATSSDGQTATQAVALVVSA